MAMAGVKASLTIHYKLLQTVLRCPLAVFAENPVGRFLNRFSSDMSTVDLVMPFTYRSVVNSILGLLITVAVVGATLPGALVAMAVLALPYALIQVCLLLDSTFADCFGVEAIPLTDCAADIALPFLAQLI